MAVLLINIDFEIASIDGQRKWVSKSGFKTKSEAKQAGKKAQNQYENYGRVVEKDEISYSDFLDYWLEKMIVKLT